MLFLVSETNLKKKRETRERHRKTYDYQQGKKSK